MDKFAVVPNLFGLRDGHPVAPLIDMMKLLPKPD
jgi:hypothetical protein